VLVIVCLLNNSIAYPTDKLILSDGDDDSSAVSDESSQTQDDEEILLLPNEIKENRSSTFQRADQNSDDKLTFDEYLYTDRLYVQVKADEFRRIDANDNGQITREEYDRHYENSDKQSMRKRVNYYGEIFSEFDSNSDRLLDATELATMLQRRYFVQVRANFDKTLASFDRNSDGGLDINEFQSFDEHIPFEQMDALTEETAINRNKPINHHDLSFENKKSANQNSDTIFA